MAVMTTIARSIGQQWRRSTINRPWQLHTSRYLILQAFAESLTLRRLSDSDSGIVALDVNRPESKNAIGKNMLRGLLRCLEILDDDCSAKVMMIRSSVPNVFCAGADLKGSVSDVFIQERRTMAPMEVQSFVNDLRSAFSLIEALSIPTIAVIEGAALGGGLEMALSCDLRICGENSVLGFPETGLAIIPGAGGTQRLSRLVGKSVAKDLIFTGRKVSGAEAYSMGLANYCVAPASAYSKALELAREINQKGPVAVRMAKQAINEGFDMDMESALKLEEDCYEEVLHTKDRLEGLTAFAQKRKPIYSGE
ncbi:hypothetical protein KSS87_020913 [Heliosperma pusillum]|nr:hypothetical protein KSS87_020913 [Heliosperma pusillum]